VLLNILTKVIPKAEYLQNNKIFLYYNVSRFSIIFG